MAKTKKTKKVLKAKSKKVMKKAMPKKQTLGDRVHAMIKEEAAKLAVQAKEDAAKLTAITDKDCLTTGTLLDAEGNTCAMGAILMAAGIKPTVGQGAATEKQLEELGQKFPIFLADESLADEIMDANDGNGYDDDATGIRERRAAVKQAIKDAAGSRESLEESLRNQVGRVLEKHGYDPYND